MEGLQNKITVGLMEGKLYETMVRLNVRQLPVKKCQDGSSSRNTKDNSYCKIYCTVYTIVLFFVHHFIEFRAADIESRGIGSLRQRLE